jgi:DNA-directed RNA polymerase subunit RPC12/RpoP
MSVRCPMCGSPAWERKGPPPVVKCSRCFTEVTPDLALIEEATP